MKLPSLHQKLSQRVITGGVWVFALRIAQQVFSLIKLLILARILAPDDFGLLGIALIEKKWVAIADSLGLNVSL